MAVASSVHVRAAACLVSEISLVFMEQIIAETLAFQERLQRQKDWKVPRQVIRATRDFFYADEGSVQNQAGTQPNSSTENDRKRDGDDDDDDDENDDSIDLQIPYDGTGDNLTGEEATAFLESVLAKNLDVSHQHDPWPQEKIQDLVDWSVQYALQHNVLLSRVKDSINDCLNTWSTGPRWYLKSRAWLCKVTPQVKLQLMSLSQAQQQQQKKALGLAFLRLSCDCIVQMPVLASES